MLILIHQVWCRSCDSAHLISSQVILMLPDCRSHIEQGSRQWYSNFSTPQNHLVQTQMATPTHISDPHDHRGRNWTDVVTSQRTLAATKSSRRQNTYSPQSLQWNPAHSRHLDSGGRGQNLHFLTDSQVTMTRLIPGPHFVNYYSRPQSWGGIITEECLSELRFFFSQHL